MDKKVAIQLQHDDRWREMIKIAGESGFKFVSMGFGSSKCFHSDGWKVEVEKIREELEKNGLKCVQTHAPYYDLLLSAEKRDEDMEKALKRSMEATKILGADICAVHPRSYIIDGAPRETVVDKKRSLEENQSSISETLNSAIKNGVLLGIENLPEFPGLPIPFYSCNPEDHVELIDSFKSDNVCAIWDFGHANLMNYNMAESIKLLGSRIKGTHVHNNEGKHDCHYPPFIPECKSDFVIRSVDWEKSLNQLKCTGFDGYLTLETNYGYTYPVDILIRYLYESVCALDDIMQKR